LHAVSVSPCDTNRFNTVIEKETVLTAVRSSSVDVLVALDFAKWSFKCDEEVLQAAAGNRSQGLRMLQLLSRQHAGLQITEPVLVAAAENRDQAVPALQFLWRQDATLQITEAVLIALLRTGARQYQPSNSYGDKTPSSRSQNPCS
jgi:hypothetical protein